MVARLGGCLSSVPAGQRRVLVLRTGSGPGEPLSRRAVAARLDATPRQVARAERRGVRHLRAAARNGGCGLEPAPAASTTTVSTTGGSEPPAAAGAPTARADDGTAVGTARSGVKESFATSPGDAERPATITTLGAGGDDTFTLVALLLLAAFGAGYTAMWARAAPPRAGRTRLG